MKKVNVEARDSGTSLQKKKRKYKKRQLGAPGNVMTVGYLGLSGNSCASLDRLGYTA